jgi:hypothetical protein
MISPAAFDPYYAPVAISRTAPAPRWTDTLSLGFVLHLISRRLVTYDEVIRYGVARFGVPADAVAAVVEQLVVVRESIDGAVLLRPLDLDRDEWLDGADCRAESLAWVFRLTGTAGYLRLVAPLD